MKSVVFLNLEIIECDSPKCFLYFFKKLMSFGVVGRIVLVLWLIASYNKLIME